MRTPSVFVSSAVVLAATSSLAAAGFTGFTTARTVLSNGNIQYKIFANSNNVGLPTGQSWVFLNAYSHTTVSGTMNAVHQDFLTADGEVGTWQAGASVSAADRDFDSWVAATGTYGSDTALDPNFNPSTGSSIPALAGWYDGTPAVNNLVDSSSMSFMVAQIVRAPTASLYIGRLELTYKASGTAVGIFGNGTFVIPGIPAPGAVALAGLAGLTGRRRR